MERSIARVNAEGKKISDYYDFSKDQHEEVLGFLENSEAKLKQNNVDIGNFMDKYSTDLSEKLKRIVWLEVDSRSTNLEI